MKYRLVETNKIGEPTIYFVEQRAFLSWQWETILDTITCSYTLAKHYYEILKLGGSIKQEKVICNQ